MSGQEGVLHACEQVPRPGGGDVWGTETAEDVRLDEEKLRAALRKQRAAERERVETDERKRKYNSLAGGEQVTAEDMEAYRLTRARADDPMAAYLNRREDGEE
jgi:pre-mRNA-processing factor SLU7